MAANPDDCALEMSLADKLRFLRAPGAYAYAPAKVELVETHMSYVFLAGARVYKLKKPVRHDFLDFSTIAAREFNCREELRLNRRLARGVYLRVVPLTLDKGGLQIGGSGRVVDWLVEMRRLPAERMFDAMIKAGTAADRDVTSICDVLARFYRRADISTLSPNAYVARFSREQAINRAILTHSDFRLEKRSLETLDHLDGNLATCREALLARARDGRILDGHGDLRPEHICLVEPVAIFDCLEFNAALRQVDPFDEIALLGVECARLGAPRLLRRFATELAGRLDCAPPVDLVSLYAGWRAVLRARLCAAHLLEPTPREPEKWLPLAQLYLDIAARALSGLLTQGEDIAVS